MCRRHSALHADIFLLDFVTVVSDGFRSTLRSSNFQKFFWGSMWQLASVWRLCVPLVHFVKIYSTSVLRNGRMVGADPEMEEGGATE